MERDMWFPKKRLLHLETIKEKKDRRKKKGEIAAVDKWFQL
jgi:hypothetical protein